MSKEEEIEELKEKIKIHEENKFKRIYNEIMDVINVMDKHKSFVFTDLDFEFGKYKFDVTIYRKPDDKKRNKKSFIKES